MQNVEKEATIRELMASMATATERYKTSFDQFLIQMDHLTRINETAELKEYILTLREEMQEMFDRNVKVDHC